MVISRVSARWASRLSQSARAARGCARTRSWQPIQRRSYASEGDHSTHQSSSDIPWAIGSLVVTLPSLYYLIQPQLQSKPEHGHGHGDGEHEEHEEHSEETEGVEGGEGAASEEQESGEEKSGEQGSEGEEGSQRSENEDGKSDASSSEEWQEVTPETSNSEEPENVSHEKEGGQNVDGVQFKGATSGGTKEGEQGDTRKHIPDAKGFNKKRIESDYGAKQGEAREPEQHPSDKDLAAASKPAGDKTTQSGKQEGLSNTDTKHSTDIVNSPEKSTKGEGTPETAKSKGTVDPNRPQV
ncbi:hypothetical protein MMC28_004298 [Mycoblastus sanguinarius]|nr:hypothetical protein [Mycoblastus sanguinarius]